MAAAHRLALGGLLLLSLSMAAVFGGIVEVTVRNLAIHAHTTSGGKPLPAATQWIYEHPAQWNSSPLFMLFLIPWAALVLAFAAGRHGPGAWAAFFLSELSLLAGWLFVALLPFLPNYMILPEAGPWGAYIPHGMILLLLAASAATAIRRWRQR